MYFLFSVKTFYKEPPSNITLYEGESFQLDYKTYLKRDVEIYKDGFGIYKRLKSTTNVLTEDRGLYYAVSNGARSKYTLLTVLRKYVGLRIDAYCISHK